MNSGPSPLASLKWLLMLAVGVGTVYTFNVPPAKGFAEPDLARVVLFHLPCALITSVYVVLAAVFSIVYLAKREMIWEHRAVAATTVTLTLGCATMATGILFSKVQWGDWWHWDPRQTSFLIVLLLLGAYFGVRMAFDEPISRARAAAAYSALTLLPVMFLIFVFPRLSQIAEKSLHPSTTVQTGSFSADYKVGYLGLFLLLLLFSTWLYRIHVRIALLEEKDMFNDGNFETSNGSAAASGVVRPVRVRK